MNIPSDPTPTASELTLLLIEAHLATPRTDPSFAAKAFHAHHALLASSQCLTAQTPTDQQLAARVFIRAAEALSHLHLKHPINLAFSKTAYDKADKIALQLGIVRPPQQD